MLLSPSKNIHAEPKNPAEKFTIPALMDETQELVSSLKKLSTDDLAKLMKISEKIKCVKF